MTISTDQIRSMRLGMDLTQTEAAAIVKVSPRTWAAWEGGSRPMPHSALNLFALRITHSSFELEAQGILIKDKARSLVVFVTKDQTPLDVIAKDNFLDVIADPKDDAKKIVSSLAVSSQGKPYVHRVSVFSEHNISSLQTLSRWKDEMDSQPG